MQWVLDVIGDFPGAVSFHHVYRGGLLQHTKEVVYFIESMYDATIHDMPKEQLIQCAWVHDLSKRFNYQEIDKNSWKLKEPYRSKYGEFELNDNPDYLFVNDIASVVALCAKNGLFLTNEQIHALTFHHGGWSGDANINCRKSTSSVFLHYADNLSVSLDRKGCRLNFDGIVLPSL